MAVDNGHNLHHIENGPLAANSRGWGAVSASVPGLGLNVLPHRDVDGEAGPAITDDQDGSQVAAAA